MARTPRNPATQYATDDNLRARQRLWAQAEDDFDLVAWVLGLTSIGADDVVLDIGCGNGSYLRALADRGQRAIGGDLSFGMLSSAGTGLLVNADAQHLPLASDTVDVVLAPHMLYHVPDRAAAAGELRRVLRAGGTCIAVTNGADHTASVVAAVETAVNQQGGSWRMERPALEAFSLENGPPQMATAFAEVEVLRVPDRPPIRVRDASIVADYVASTADHYGPTVELPWSTVVERVHRAVAAVIDRDGAFEVRSDVGAIICR